MQLVMQPHLAVKRLCIMKKPFLSPILFAAAMALFSCNKTEELSPEPCTGIEPTRLTGSFFVDGFFPLHSRYYWLYNDTLFDQAGNIESTTVRMLSAKEGYTHSFREAKSPILVSFSSILPDLAFRNDSVFLTGTRHNLHSTKCVMLFGPLLFPTTDTIKLNNADTLMPFPQAVITPAGTFNNNFIVQSSSQTLLFSREIGLLHRSDKLRNPNTGAYYTRRSVWLKEAVLDGSMGRWGN